jgi:hypothetical protein
MRFLFVVIACAVVIVGSAAAAETDSSFNQSGFRVSVPAGWTERPDLAQKAADGERQAVPQGSILSARQFAWSNSKHSVFVLIQALRESAQVADGQIRATLQGEQEAAPQSDGVDATASINDDGTVMTGLFEGTSSNGYYVVQHTDAMVDSDRHLNLIAVSCAIRVPLAKDDRAACQSFIDAYNLTIDRSALLPLEPK